MGGGKIKSSEKKSNKNIMKKKNGMFWCFPLIPNTKHPACKWKSPSEQKQVSVKVNNKKNICNLGVPCGKRNNLCVIDIDCAKDESFSDNVFFQTFGDAENWFKIFGCPVVKSQSGGYHLWFQEQEEVLQTQNAETHIDVRAEGGYIICPGSMIDGRKYEIVQGDIEKIPKMTETLIEFMKLNYVGSKNSEKPKSRVRTKIIKSKDGKEIIMQEMIGCDQSLYRYDYSDFMLNNIIKGLPKKYFNEYHYWLIFTTAMKQIDRQDLWIHYSKKFAEKEYNELYNLDIWNGITGHKYILAINHILKESSYKNARTSLDYYKYKAILKNKIKPHQKINRKKLGINEQQLQEDYFKKLAELKKIIMMKSDTGTGKTTAFKKYIKMKDKKFLSLVSRKTLGEEQYHLFCKFGIDCSYYEYERFEGDSYICQVDSIMKLGYAISEGWFSDYDIFMDEYNSIIKYIFTSSTLNKTRVLVIEHLINILKQAERIWCVDADISDSSILFMKENIDFNLEDTLFIENEYKHNNNTEAQEMYSYEDIIEKMKDETEMIIPCDEARTCHMIEEELKQHENKKDKKIVVIDRLTDNEILSGFNMDDYDIVLFSPKIVYGLDSVRKRSVFAVYKESTIDAKDMVQQINRCRNIKKLWFYFERKTCYDCDFNTFQDCVDDTKNIQKWCEKNDHLHMEMNYSGQMYQNIFNRFKYDDDAFKTNPSAHFRRIIKDRGFNVLTTIYQSKSIEPKLRNDKERRVENITPELKFVQEQNKFLLLDNQQIMEHKEIFLESQFITQFLNSKLYMFSEYGKRYNPVKKEWKDDFKEIWCEEKQCDIIDPELSEKQRYESFIEKLKSDIEESQDYSVNKITSGKNRILFIDKVRRAVEIPNKFSIENPKPVEKKVADELLSEYLSTFRSSAKFEENPFESEKGIQEIFCKMYKNVFGCAPFRGKEEKYTDANGERKSRYIYVDDMDNKKFKRMKTIFFQHKKNYVKKKEKEHEEMYGYDSE